MIYILKDIGKGKIGFGERQITKDNLFRLDAGKTTDTNYYVNTATFSDGVLILTRNEGGSISIPLDGRYLQSYTEQDPTVPQHVKNITTNNISNWNNGYYDDITNMQLTRSGDDLVITMFKRNGDTISQQIKVFVNNITEIPNRSYNDLQDLPSLNINNWNTAFEWGNHSSQGYITGITNLTEIPNRSYNDLQDLPDINGIVSVVDQNLSTDKHVIATVANKNVSETVTRLNQPVLSGNTLTLKFINENNVEQTVSIDLSSISTNTSGINNASYNAATNIITLTEDDGDTWTIDLSEFSIVTTTNEAGVTDLVQEGSVKLRVSKVGQTGEWIDILNRPTTIGGYNISDAYTKQSIDNFFSGTNPIIGYSKSNWDVAFGWGNHSTQGYLTQYQNVSWDNTLGNLSITNGNTISMDGRYALITSLKGLATNGLSIQDINGNEQFVSTDLLKFGNVIFDTDNKTITVPETPPQNLEWNGNISGNLSISDGNSVNLDDRYSRNPNGVEGQLYYIDETGTNHIIPDYPLKRGIVVENQEEFDLAQFQGLTLGEVFNNWRMFSHYFGSIESEQSPPSFPALNSSESEEATRLTAEEFYGKSAWGYDDINERIYLTKNYNPYTGFISPNKYSNYNLGATFSSINNDDDQMGLVIGFYKDPTTGFEYTLSVIRTLHQISGQGDYSYAVIYNYGQNLTTSPYYNPEYSTSSQSLLIDRTNLAPVPAGATGWVGNATRVEVERVNDIFAIKTSQFGSDVIDEATLITLDLSTYPELSVFSGSSEIGFSAKSQKDAYFSDIVFTGFVDYIFWNQGSNIYETWEFSQDTQNYVLQNPKSVTAQDYFGVSRFIYSYLFDKTYYINENDIIIKIGGGPSQEDFDAHVEDLNNPHQVSKEQVGLGNVDNTADIDKPVSSLQQTEITRVENLIPNNNNQLTNGAGYLESINHDTKIRTIKLHYSQLSSVTEEGLLEYLNNTGFVKGDMENILFEVDTVAAVVVFDTSNFYSDNEKFTVKRESDNVISDFKPSDLTSGAYTSWLAGSNGLLVGMDNEQNNLTLTNRNIVYLKDNGLISMTGSTVMRSTFDAFFTNRYVAAYVMTNQQNINNQRPNFTVKNNANEGFASRVIFADGSSYRAKQVHFAIGKKDGTVTHQTFTASSYDNSILNVIVLEVINGVARYIINGVEYTTFTASDSNWTGYGFSPPGVICCGNRYEPTHLPADYTHFSLVMDPKQTAEEISNELITLYQ